MLSNHPNCLGGNSSPASTSTGGVAFQGSWNASTNTPTLTSSVGTTGYFYIVSVAGSTNLDGITDWEVGDWAIFGTTTWTKVDNTDKVSSVFGRVGSVVGVSTDYSAVGITNTSLGASNPSTVAATTITASSTIAATGAVTGSNLSGTNTGNQTITLTGGVTGSGTGSFAATVVTNANLTGVITSVGNATSIASQTGTGTKFVVDTSPILVTPNLGTPSAGNLGSCTTDGTNKVGFLIIPQNSQSAAYTLVLADAGKHIFHPSSDANARTYTIPANSSVDYTIGTAITFVNMTSQVVSIAITTDTMYLSSAGTTGTRSLAQYGSATAIKMTSTTWLISGSGLT